MRTARCAVCNGNACGASSYAKLPKVVDSEAEGLAADAKDCSWGPEGMYDESNKY